MKSILLLASVALLATDQVFAHKLNLSSIKKQRDDGEAAEPAKSPESGDKAEAKGDKEPEAKSDKEPEAKGDKEPGAKSDSKPDSAADEKTKEPKSDEGKEKEADAKKGKAKEAESEDEEKASAKKAPVSELESQSEHAERHGLDWNHDHAKWANSMPGHLLDMPTRWNTGK